jgi:thiol-disulfide isomerase/thioredoxin
VRITVLSCVSRTLLTVGLVCASLAWNAQAVPQTEGVTQDDPPPPAVVLKVGDPAPTMGGLNWVKGTGVESFAPGTIYVLDFWATWCGPCVNLIPEMTALAQRHANENVRVLGISVWENGPDRPLGNATSYADKVRTFVARQGDRMGYDVAYEGDNGTMGASWMRAARRVSIPSVFVVDKAGKIAWIGHPSMGLDEFLPKLIAGDIDPVAYDAEMKAREAKRLRGMRLATRLQEATGASNHDEALRLCDEILALDAEMFAPTNISKLRVLWGGLRSAERGAAFAQEVMNSPQAQNRGVMVGMAGVILLEHDAPRDNVVANALLDKAAQTVEDASVRATLTGTSDADEDQSIARLEKFVPFCGQPARRMLESMLLRRKGDTPQTPAPAGG